MISRLTMPLLLGAAVGVPYVATNLPDISAMVGKSAQAPASPEEQAELLKKQGNRPQQPPMPQGPGSTLYRTATPLEGLPSVSLHEVFNMNVTKEWVYQRWARKSTALSELGMFGIRVPLVSGTQLHDLAGSLTYFFDNSGRVQRISFHGTTGDTSQIVMLATQHFGLQPQPTPVAGEQLFQTRRQNLVYSELRTRPAAVLWASSPHDSFTVDVDLQSPYSQTPLPPRQSALSATPSSPSASQPPASAQPPDDQTAKPAEESSKGWDNFFPRSRIPKEQVESLDRHSDLW